MITWLQQLQGEINSIDLTKPCPTQKILDVEEEILGELDEYLQKFYRVYENYKEKLYFIQDKMFEQCETHADEEFTKKNCSSHYGKIDSLFDQFKARLFPFLRVNSIFLAEIEHNFPLESVQASFIGIRNGYLLINREDNSRQDEEFFTDFLVEMEALLGMTKPTS